VRILPPNRVTRTFTQKLAAAPERVFPLLCPVREADWLSDWDPIAVFSDSGVAEPDCVFVTSATPHEAIWFITNHEPGRGFVQMLKVVPEVTACKLSIQLSKSETGCEALVTYSHTSLGPHGDAFVDGFTEAFYERFMREWESRLNHYLTTGLRQGA
jgi:hypothetical protein